MLKIELCDYDRCTGCRACGDFCPKNCITYIENDEGFCRPLINRDICICCGKCMKICPIISPPGNNNQIAPNAYHAYSLDKGIVKNSSSGGIFTELSKLVISQDGVVCGVTQEHKTLKTKNIMVYSIDELSRLKGSKYVQSDASKIYITAYRALREGKCVLFSGTPCQIAAMKNIAKIHNLNNIYLVEVICHGVPSHKYFDEYISKLGNSEVCSFLVRNNRIWDFDTFYYDRSNNRHWLLGSKDFYMKSFLYGEIFQKVCYSCPFAQLPRFADITLGDFWGVEKCVKSKDINKSGNSLVLINNGKGYQLFNDISGQIFSNQTSLTNACKRNHNIYEPSSYKTQRGTIYQDMGRLTLQELASKYNHSFSFRNYLGFIKRRIKEFLLT